MTVLGIILILLSAGAFAGFLMKRPEEAPQEKQTGTGVIEYVIPGAEATGYVIRFTGQRNKSHLAKTPAYIGKTEKYPEGKFVHIRYWFGKKTVGAEIIDEELTAVARKEKGKMLILLGGLLLIAGVVCLFI